MEHALRACTLAVRLGDALGLSEQELADVYYLTLLRYIGCTTENSHTAATFGDEFALGKWLTPVFYGSPGETLITTLHHVGEDRPPLGRARQLATALVRMPGMTKTAAAHCEVAQA